MDLCVTVMWCWNGFMCSNGSTLYIIMPIVCVCVCVRHILFKSLCVSGVSCVVVCCCVCVINVCTFVPILGLRPQIADISTFLGMGVIASEAALSHSLMLPW